MKLHLPLSLLTILFAAFTMQVNGSVVTDFSNLTNASDTLTQTLTLDGGAELSFTISSGKTWIQEVNHSTWGNLDALNEMNEVLGTSFTTVGLTEYTPYCSGAGGSDVTLALSNSGIEAGKTAVFYALVTKIGATFTSKDNVTVSGLDSCTIEFAGIGGEGWGATPSANANEYSLVKITGTVNSNENPISITGQGKLAFGMLTYQEYGGRYYWEGGNGAWSNLSTNKNWSATDESTEGLEAYSSYSIAHFTGTGSTITVSDDVYAAGMKVSGAGYTFSIDKDAKLSTGNIEIAEGASMSVDGAGSLELRGVIKNNGTLTLAGNIYLTDHDHKSRVYSEGNNGYLAGNAYNLIIGAEKVTNNATIWSNGENVTLTKHHGNLYYVVDGGDIEYDESKYYVQEGTVQQSSLSEVGSNVVIVVHNDGQTMTGKLELNSDFANTITGTGGVIINTDGTMTLSGANTYTGGTAVTGGTLIAATTGALGTGSVTLSDDTKLIMNAGGETSVSGGNNDANASVALTISGTETSVLELNLETNTGYEYNNTVQLSKPTEDDSMVGTVRIASGALANRVFGNIGTATDLAGANLQMANGTMLILRKPNGDDFGAGDIRLEGTTTLVAYDNTFTLQNNITSADGCDGKLVKTDAGTVTLSGNNTYTGGTTIVGGKVIVAAGSSLGTGDVAVNNSSSKLELQVDGTFANAISGTGGVIVDTDGTVTLSGNNTYTGGITIDNGILKVGHKAALGSSTESSVTVNDGGTLDMNGTADVTNAVTLNKGATLTNTGDEIGTNMMQLPNVTLGGDATVTGSGNFAMIASDHTKANLDLAGNTLTKTGSNTFTLCNTNVTAGTLKVTEGTLKAWKTKTDYLDISEATVEVGRVGENNVGTFQLSGNSEAIKALKFDGGKVSVDNGYKLTVSGATTVTAQGATLKGSLEAVGGVQLKDSSDTLAASISGGSTLTNVTLSNTGIGAVAGTQGSIANALVELKQNSSFSITDVTMSNVEISAAEVSTPVLLQPVKATDVSLTKGTFMTEGDVEKTESGSTPYAYSTDALSGITLNNEAQTANIVLNLGGMSDFAQNAMGICDISITLTDFSVNAVNLKGIYFAADSWLGQLLAAQGADAYVKDSILSVAQVYNLTDSAAGSTNVSVSFETSGDDTVITITGLDMVPEPTTTTLSLLALTALAARRRRR